MSLFSIRAASQIGWVSYFYNHTLQSLLLCDFLCLQCTYRITQQYKSYMDILRAKQLLYYLMSIFWIKAACKIQLASYGSKHTPLSLSATPLVHALVHKLTTIGRTCIWMFCILNDCSGIRGIPCVLKSWRGNPTGEVWPNTRIGVVLWCNIIMHMLEASTHIAI